MFERRSALSAQISLPGRDGASGQRALRISEVRGWSLAQLCVFGGRERVFADALRTLIGDDLPSAVGQQIICHGAKIFRMTPNRYWAVAPDEDFAAALARTVPAAAGTATALSHSRTLIALEGSGARALLAKGVGIDLHPTVFRIGHFAETALHHTGVLLERCGAERYQLFLPRTLAASIWDWLTDAALPLGYDVGTEVPLVL